MYSTSNQSTIQPINNEIGTDKQLQPAVIPIHLPKKIYTKKAAIDNSRDLMVLSSNSHASERLKNKLAFPMVHRDGFRGDGEWPALVPQITK
jgi:hypothetical protein